MHSYAFVFLAALAVAHAGVLVAPAANVLQGPSSRTTLVGPEGSVISSVAPGGQVISDVSPGVSAYSAPVVAAAPVVAPAAYAAAPIALAAPAPLVAGSVNTVLSGPSGTVAASRALTASDVVAPNVVAW